MTDQRLLVELLRSDFATFAARAFFELYPAEQLDWNWHLDVIIGELAELSEGRRRRQLILVPPRSLKSFICSIAWPMLTPPWPSMRIPRVCWSTAA